MSGKVRGRHVVSVEPVLVHIRRSSDVIAVDDPAVLKALRFMCDYSNYAVGVGDVVEQTGACRRTLERRFLYAAGCSILTELTRCRLDRAGRLLLETELLCRQISRDAAFGSVKAFNRTFRRAEGVSPAQFRRQRTSRDAREARRAKSCGSSACRKRRSDP